MEHLWTQFCGHQEGQKMSILCMGIAPIGAPTQGAVPPSEVSFPARSAEEDSAAHGPLLWTVMKFQATQSRPALQELSSPTFMNTIY